MPKRLNRVGVTCLGPQDKLSHIDAPIGRFAVVDVTLRLPEPFSQQALRQPGLLSQPPKKRGQRSIARSVLGLCGHLTRFSGQRELTRVACQGQDEVNDDRINLALA